MYGMVSEKTAFNMLYAALQAMVDTYNEKIKYNTGGYANGEHHPPVIQAREALEAAERYRNQ